MNNQRPLSKKKTLQLFLLLTILAWATQTLFHQWGYGQEVEPNTATAAGAAAPPIADGDAIGQEKFIAPAHPAGAVLELRSEATVLGAEVKLKQICRWSNGDAAIFSPIADLTVARMTGPSPFRRISIGDVRQTLHDAGVNLATINFAGSVSCTVTRSDLPSDAGQGMQQWIDAQKPVDSPAMSTPATRPASSEIKIGAAVHSLRDLLTDEIGQRLNISPEALQMQFDPENEKVLGLMGPLFKFDIKPSRGRDLGRVSWDVAIMSDTSTKNVSLSAMARAWQNELIVARPLAAKQLLKDEDFTQRRVLLDSLPSDPLLTAEQCVGQQTSRDLKPGTVMTARMVDPVPLVHGGQLVTITLTQGTVTIRAVARAMEQGTLGQTIKVRNETTREMFDVTVTGPQEARLGESDAGASIASARN